MFEVGDRVTISNEFSEWSLKVFGEENLTKWGVDVNDFGEGTILELHYDEGEYAVIDWENPQTLLFGDEPNRLLNEVNTEWLEKVA